MKNKIAFKIHKLYETAFGGLREAARHAGVTIKALLTQDPTTGKILRRGTPGAFGHDLRPTCGAKTTRQGLRFPGNSRQRRFMRRHPQHSTSV